MTVENLVRIVWGIFEKIGKKIKNQKKNFPRVSELNFLSIPEVEHEIVVFTHLNFTLIVVSFGEPS